jgi:hypothetical protein
MILILHVIFYFFKWLDQKTGHRPPQSFCDHRYHPNGFKVFFLKKTGIRFVQISGAMV